MEAEQDEIEFVKCSILRADRGRNTVDVIAEDICRWGANALIRRDSMARAKNTFGNKDYASTRYFDMVGSTSPQRVIDIYV
jgi:hypothetical protein